MKNVKSNLIKKNINIFWFIFINEVLYIININYKIMNKIDYILYILKWVTEY